MCLLPSNKYEEYIRGCGGSGGGNDVTTHSPAPTLYGLFEELILGKDEQETELVVYHVKRGQSGHV